jgi:S1-C subfamily serine protease
VIEYPQVRRSRSRRGFVVAIVLTLLLAMGVVRFEEASASPAVVASPDTVAAQTQTTTQQSAAAPSVADVAAKADQAVVTITNYQQVSDQFGGRQRSGQNGQNGQNGSPQAVDEGSGYIIDDAGHVVTNAHVVAGGVKFTVQFADGTSVPATLVGMDDLQDVAVLKLDLSGGQKVPGTVAFGDSSTVRAGDEVVAIGSPFGEFTNTVTQGIVNGLNRSLDTGEGYRLPNLIQHDAPIYPGNSGGPLLNMQGQVIGMNVAKATPAMLGDNSADNFGFAIASNAVKADVDQILATGKVARPYLGIQGQEQPDGQVVVVVSPNSPAEQAGLQAGDVITKVDGKQISDQNPLANLLIFSHKPGDTVTLTIERNGTEQTVTVTLGERPSNSQ